MQAEPIGGSDRATARTLEIVRDQLERAGVAPDDAAAVVLTVVALCSFPLAHAETVARVLALDPRAAAEADAHKRYVSQLVAGGAAAARAARTAGRSRS